MKTLNWIYTIGILVAIDQLSKATAINNFPEIFVKNFGSAFSIMFPINLTILLSIVFISFASYLVMFKKEPYSLVWGLSVSGGIGNLIDRVTLGYVVDFIHVGRFPVFNFADIYLTVSAGLLIYFYILAKREIGS
jgi:signal peptidase II